MPENVRAEVLILGRGAMGGMFASLLRGSAHVTTWDRDPETGRETEPLEELAPGSDIAILAVPAAPHDELAGRLAACLGSGSLCLSIAKGLDSEGRTPAAILERHFGEVSDTGPGWGVIYGPMIAGELRAGRAGFAMVASRPSGAAERVRALFSDGPLHLRPHNDPKGASWSAILKNIYVPLIGMADALELGDNMRGFLIAEALEELASIVEHLGGDRQTPYTLAGLGDLVTTATSPGSHHRGIGEAIAQGKLEAAVETGDNVRSEGVHAVAQLRRHGLLEFPRYPLLEFVAGLLDSPADPQARLEAWIRRRFAAL